MRMRLTAVPLLLGLCLLPAISSIVIQAQVPQPFPKPADPNRPGGQAPPPTTRPGSPGPAAPAGPGAQAGVPEPAGEAAPTEARLGAPIYPNAQYLTSYSAGQGQRYYLFGASASFAEVVNFYRTSLRQRGEVVFEEPATHMFEIGRYREDTMAFPPSVTVKDYTWGNLGGYLNPKRGGQPARFPTVIQMVPAPDGASR